MLHAAHSFSRSGPHGFAVGAVPLISSDADEHADAHYWPCDVLNAFILKMAANGRCVNAAMMLGHRTYALAQIAAAHAVGDEALAALAARLQAFFDAHPEGGPAVARSTDGTQRPLQAAAMA